MYLLKTRFAIDDFIVEMMRIPIERLQLSQLQAWVSQLELKDDLFRHHLCFRPEQYQRRLLCRTPRFDMLILCWQPGQASTIHDHQDSLNVTRVYRGQLTSRCFAAAEATNRPRLTQEVHLGPGDLAVVDRHQIHQLANTSNENLVTLHVYARPLQEITVYCPQSGIAESISVPYSLQ